jgi:hypothetical protein
MRVPRLRKAAVERRWRRAHIRSKTHKKRAGAWAIDFVRISQKAPSGRYTRRPLNLSSHNHNQRDRRPRFSLAVLAERSKLTPRYAVCLLRNRASNLSGTAIPLHADCATLHRSTAAEPSCVRCKRCARPGDADDNRTALYGGPPRDLPSWARRLHFRSLIAEVQRTLQNFELVQGDTGAERQSASMLWGRSASPRDRATLNVVRHSRVRARTSCSTRLPERSPPHLPAA